MSKGRILKLLAVVLVSLFLASCLLSITKSSIEADSNWIAKPMHVVQSADPYAFSGYSPSQIKAAYGLPASGGLGTTIAIIDAYYTPGIATDLATFSNQFNLPPPTASNFEIYPMPGLTNKTDSSWETETCLDVEWAHAIAPQAKILLVEATSANMNALLPAINYATSRPDVVAVSMSWGANEVSQEVNYDSIFNSNFGAAFFASSGDNGAGVCWPACSPNVTAVGGTTLIINADNTVNSETAWNGSGGGISDYELAPTYQTNYGLASTFREVPDVSYDANPTTGFAVYCSPSWYIVGGTSAGAPQWAAIYALDRSATNVNLYVDAKNAYSTYFRDITVGSNGVYNASIGYDCVTGLGSPLTDKFNVTLTVSPDSGSANEPITLDGMGFTANSSVNVSYFNPVNSTWIPLDSNVSTTSFGNFSYSLNAPDLQQSNLVGDNPPLSDKIVFRALNNNNGEYYNTTIPYTEWRRGLAQVANSTSIGLYGNNTNLATNTFVQNDQTISVAGEYFSPGNASLYWDNISLGTTTVDETGFFNATVIVPNTFAGQHTITIRDESSTFCINVTRLPIVTNNYDGLWHTSDFTVSLTPDYNVTETYYRINNGSVENLSANGQPLITIEGNNNTLEYWSEWNVYGTALMELPHVTVTGIKLDKTPPQGWIEINNDTTYTSSTDVTLTINAVDQISGISQMRLSNYEDLNQSTWQPFTSSCKWQLTSGDGVKTVYCQIENNAGLIANLNASITLGTPQPMATPMPTIAPQTTIAPNPSATPMPSPTPNVSQTPVPSNSPQVPESNPSIVLTFLGVLTVLIAAIASHKCKRQSQ